MEQVQTSLSQQALELAEKLSLEDQETLIEVLQRRLAEWRRADIARNAAATLQAVQERRAAVLQFNQREYSKRHGMLAWACVDYLLVRDQYPHAGDHAAGWETSHVMALHPQTVDLSELPPKGETLVGIGGWMPPQDATADFGRETFEAAAEIAVREVQHRLTHKHLYRGHGNSLREGLWREDV